MSNSDTTINKEFPTGWRMVRLWDAIEELKNGFASGKRDENGIVQIRMNNVTTDGHLIFDSYLKVPVPENLNYWLLKKGDLLFNNTNSIDLVGKSAIFNEAPFPCTFSNHFTRIRFKKELVLPELILYHFIIMWEKSFFKSVAIRHVGQSAVHTDYLLKLQIPLPPLPEQRRIAEVLGTVDSAIQKVGGAIESTERLKKGLMQRLLTRGIGHERFKFSKELGCEIPEEWTVVKMGDIADDFVGGGTPSTSNPDYWNGKIAWMTSSHINGRTVNSGQRLITEKGLKESSTHLIPKGNLLVATRVGIGKAAINSIDVAISQDLTGVIINKDKVNADYIYWFLLINLNKLKSLAQGSTIKGILKDDLTNLKLPLPPLPEQRRIAEILSAADKKLELERRRKEKLERLKKGMMNDLLTGRKRVNMEEM
jgi:type I restriction enzyme S subunit